MAGKLTIRRVGQTDVGAVVELWKELMDFHKAVDPFWTRSRTGHKTFGEYLVKECMGGDQRRAWVAQAGNKIVGFCIAVIKDYPPCLQTKQHGKIECLAVTKRWRNKGVGEKLLKRTRTWFAKKGMTRIEVAHSTANELAAGFYAKMGFRPYVEIVYQQL